MRVRFKILTVILASLLSGCAGNYTTESGKERNAWVDLLVVASAMPDSRDSPSTRARKSGIVTGYLSDEDSSDYDGNCECPYDIAEDGTRCGSRSAWSKPKGETPTCNYNQITSEDINEKWK